MTTNATKAKKPKGDIRRVLLDLYDIRMSVAAGGYGPEEHNVLAASLSFAKAFFNLRTAEISERIGVSYRILSNLADGGTPKLENFLRCTNNLILLFEEWIADHPEIAPVVSGVPADWRVLRNTAAQKIQVISEQIVELLDVVRHSNALAMSDTVLPPELKAQLIALLEATLAQLRSPLVEKSFITKIGNWLLGLSKKAAVDLGAGVFEKLAKNVGGGLIDVMEDTLT